MSKKEKTVTKRILAIGLLGLAPTVRLAIASDAMPAAQQNALVQKYCAVCHTDAQHNGGLSLQHFDASHADPADAAMMLAKLKTGALGAAGVPDPDKATVDAWISATAREASGSGEWTLEPDKCRDGVRQHRAGGSVRRIPRATRPIPIDPDMPPRYSPGRDAFSVVAARLRRRVR